MSFPLLLVTEFRTLFSGNTNGKGQTQVEQSKSQEGKQEAKSWVSKVPLSDDDYINHLEGKLGLGISPIMVNNKCRFGVIDVDVYQDKTNLARHIEIVYKFGLPLVPVYSKSGGLHLYMFFDEEVIASEVIELLQSYRKLLGLPKDTEVFPKQRTIPADGVGNWINLPYFDADNPNNQRKVIAHDNKLLDLEEGLDYCRKMRRSHEVHSMAFKDLPLSDAPPCLQSIYIQRDTPYRNEYLFSLARYYKAKVGDGFEFELTEANNLLFRPIEISELDRSIIRSHKKKDYSYKCGSPPIQSICDKEECKKRAFGIGSDFISELSYEEFTQYKSDPPWYEWVINGQVLQFFNEGDIINQYKFRELCFRKLHIMPNRLTDAVWSKVVNNALKNLTVKEVDPEDDISTGRMFMEYLTEFLTGRVMADNKEQILINRVYHDLDHKTYVFKATALIEFIFQVKSFKYYKDVEIQSRLKELGARPVRYYINQRARGARVWEIPTATFEMYKDQANMKDIILDFMDKDKVGEPF